MDPASQTVDAAASVSPTRKKAREDSTPYSFGADRRSQLKTTDLMPKRLLSCMFVVLVLVASIGILNLLAAYAGHWSTQIGESGAVSLSLAGRGTLSSWFSSFLLIITGLASLQIYALRQHRRDDYRGTYRLWLWMSALFMVASLNCVVDLEAICANLLSSLAFVTFSRTSWLPMAIKLLILSSLVARGLYEVRESRGAFALVVVVWVAYSAAAVLQLPSTQPAMVSLGHDAVLGNCLLFATVALLLAELTYARFIYLQAHGLIKPRVVRQKKTKAKSAPASKATTKSTKKSKAKKTRKDSSEGQESGDSVVKPALAIGTEPAAGTTAPPAKTKRAKAKSTGAKAAGTKSNKSQAKKTAQPEANEYDDENQSILKMSKADRRKQRKQQKNQRRAA